MGRINNYESYLENVSKILNIEERVANLINNITPPNVQLDITDLIAIIKASRYTTSPTVYSEWTHGYTVSLSGKVNSDTIGATWSLYISTLKEFKATKEYPSRIMVHIPRRYFSTGNLLMIPILFSNGKDELEETNKIITLIEKHIELQELAEKRKTNLHKGSIKKKYINE